MTAPAGSSLVAGALGTFGTAITSPWGAGRDGAGLRTTHFICLTMVLFPDSPAPAEEGDRHTDEL